MQKLAPWTQQWQHFTSEVREQFWGDLAQHTRQSWQDLLAGSPSRPGIAIWGSERMNAVRLAPMPETGFMSGTL